MDTHIPNTLFIIKMKKEIQINTIVWLLLVAFICLNTVFAEKSFQSAYILITIVSVIKFLSVTFQFVEVKHAHLIWKLVSILFILIYTGGVLVIY